MSTNPSSKTSKTTNRHEVGGEDLQTPKRLAAKTSKTSEGDSLGLVATWSAEFGYVSIHDPVEGVWWDLQAKDAPDWAVSEARKRKELYRDGDRRAYRLTSHDMQRLWDEERPAEAGIVEEHPLEEE